MALRKVKGNFERMFDKNLTDLVRGIRNNKENEVNLSLRLAYYSQIFITDITLVELLIHIFI